MITIIKKITKKLFNIVGADVIRLKNSPKHTLLGLRNLPINSIIDVGANKGQFAKYISAFFPKAHLYSFEPLPEPYEELNRWAEGRINVRIFNCALGEKEDVIEIFNHVDHSPSSSFLKTTGICEEFYPFTKKQSRVSVNMSTLDKWHDKLPERLIPEVLIKMDVQGYEDRVIRAGQETFKLAKACVLEINLDNLYESQTNFNNIILLLYDLGYRYGGNLGQTHAGDGHVIFIDAVFIKHDG